MSLHLRPPLNSSIFHASPKRWMIPTNISATGRGTKTAITGIMMVEMPKPVVVPTVEATRVRRTRRAASTVTACPARNRRAPGMPGPCRAWPLTAAYLDPFLSARCQLSLFFKALHSIMRSRAPDPARRRVRGLIAARRGHITSVWKFSVESRAGFNPFAKDGLEVPGHSRPSRPGFQSNDEVLSR